jgi:hypothetical protein
MYGNEFLLYVLARESVPEAQALNEGQQRTLALLRQFASDAQAQGTGFVQSVALGQLASYQPQFGTSTANVLRMQSGGSIPGVEETEDRVWNALARLARDIYPAFLLPQPDDTRAFPGPTTSIAGPVFNSPVTHDLLNRVLQDASLDKLFPGHPPDLELPTAQAQLTVSSDLVLSSGTGGTFSLSMIPTNLPVHAYRLTMLRGVAGQEAYMETVRALLQEVRQLANGREVRVPMLVGLANVELAPGVEVQLNSGVLRAVRPIDEDLLHTSRRSNAFTAVLEEQVPLRILDRRPWQPEAHDAAAERFAHWERYRPRFQRSQESTDRAITLSRYALLLASDETHAIGATVVAHTILDPLRGGGSVSARIAARATATVVIDSAIAQRAKEWSQQITNRHPKNLDTGMRRVLNAASKRLDPIDGLVDSVICWENMFGTSQGESVFRICGAMARLLEPQDQDQRLQLLHTLQNLYALRSKVVHGGKAPTPRDAIVARDEALAYALRALRQLYDHPQLLAAADSGTLVLHSSLRVKKPAQAAFLSAETDNHRIQP